MSFETGWCDECGMPIGVGECDGCLAYSSVCADLDGPEISGNDIADEIEAELRHNSERVC